MLNTVFVVASVCLAAVRISAVAIWGQCGGIGWTGGTACDSGTICVVSNPYYSQCLPGTATTSPAPISSAPATSSSASSAPSSTPTLGPSSCSSTPAIKSGYSNSALPDPFTFANGSKVQTLADWECRRNEIMSFIQGYEAGFLPPKPPLVSGTVSGNTLTVTAGGFTNTSSISFSNTITYPSGTAPANGWPLIIALDGGSIPVPGGIAVLNYNEGTLAQQTDTTSRGKGSFYSLYGSSASASALTAWTWGISRIIDVLEVTPAAKVDVTKIAVTGCSRDGKGALMAGAFEPRIALTIVQESGSGGAACWRLSLYEQNQGQVVQTATEIVTENVWFSTTFNSYVNQLNVLPYDHHLLAALVAPRGLIVLDNTDYVWLSSVSNYGCMSATRLVYQALGAQQNFGFIQQGGHAHCAFPTNQTTDLDAYIGKFLQGQTSANTNFFLTNNAWHGVSWVSSNWINWAVPTLT